MEWKKVKWSLFSQGSKLTLNVAVMKLNAMFDRLINDNELEKKATIKQLALLSKSDQNGG